MGQNNLFWHTKPSALLIWSSSKSFTFIPMAWLSHIKQWDRKTYHTQRKLGKDGCWNCDDKRSCDILNYVLNTKRDAAQKCTAKAICSNAFKCFTTVLKSGRFYMEAVRAITSFKRSSNELRVSSLFKAAKNLAAAPLELKKTALRCFHLRKNIKKNQALQLHVLNVHNLLSQNAIVNRKCPVSTFSP